MLILCARVSSLCGPEFQSAVFREEEALQSYEKLTHVYIVLPLVMQIVAALKPISVEVGEGLLWWSWSVVYVRCVLFGDSEGRERAQPAAALVGHPARANVGLKFERSVVEPAAGARGEP
ncbi:hypothetical protein SRHO_G00138690 [Serrasalmus rhombeus]